MLIHKLVLSLMILSVSSSNAATVDKIPVNGPKAVVIHGVAPLGTSKQAPAHDYGTRKVPHAINHKAYQAVKANPVRPGNTVAPQVVAPTSVTYANIYKFPNINNNNMADVGSLIAKLQSIHSGIQVSQVKGTSCENASFACVVVKDGAAQTAWDANQNQFTGTKYSHTLTGTTVRQNYTPPTARSLGTSGGPVNFTGTGVINGSQIPDNYPFGSGGFQEYGLFFPYAVSNTAFITSVGYDIEVYHPYPSDLKITADFVNGSTFTANGGYGGYNSSTYTSIISPGNTIPGGTFHIVDQPSSLNPSGSNTSNWYQSPAITSWNGYSPDQYFYVDAWDTDAGGVGTIDYVYWTINYQDYSDLTFVGGLTANTNNGVYPDNTYFRYLDLYSDIENNSGVDSGAFNLDWYLLPDLYADGCISTHLTNATISSAYSLGGLGITNLGSYSSLQFNTYTGNNIAQAPFDLSTIAGLTPGTYCVFAYVNSTGTAYEFDYTNNVSEMGPFNYWYTTSSYPDLTFDYNSTNNDYTIDGSNNINVARFQPS